MSFHLDNLFCTYLIWYGISSAVIAYFDRLMEVLCKATFAESLEISFVATTAPTLFKMFLCLANFDLFLNLLELFLLEKFCFFFQYISLAIENILHAPGDVVNIVKEVVCFFFIESLCHSLVWYQVFWSGLFSLCA